MRRFRQISAEELLKMIPMASNIVILEENGDGWYWMSDYVTDRFENANILIEEPEIPEVVELAEPEETSPAAEEPDQAEAERTPEEDLFDRINKLSASSKKEQESVDPEKCLAIIKGYLGGMNIKEVAKELNVTQKTAREVLLKNRTPLRVSRAFYKSIREAVEDGRALEDIAEDFHTDVDHIREIIDGGKE